MTLAAAPLFWHNKLGPQLACSAGSAAPPSRGIPAGDLAVLAAAAAEASATLVAVLLGLSPLPAAEASAVSRPSGAPARCGRDCLLPVLLEMSGLLSGQEKMQHNPQML